MVYQLIHQITIMKTLTVFIFIVSVCVVVSAPPKMTAENILKIMEECRVSSKATEEDVKSIINSHSNSNKATKCMLACINKKSGVMDDDNTINIENSQLIFEPIKVTHPEKYKKAVEIMETCKIMASKETDECDIAKIFNDCTEEKMAAEAIPNPFSAKN